MAKVQISQVAELLKKHKIEPTVAREIVEELNETASPAGEEGESAPAVKKQFAVLLMDDTGRLPKDLVGWVVQIPEDASPHSIPDRLHKGAYDFNASKKGRMLPVKSIGTAIEGVTAKYFRESELWIKTKLPCAVVVINNVLPTEKLKPDADV